MTIARYIYAGFTAQQLKNRASIPSQADITVNANNIVCGHTDIPTEIKAVLGESTNDCGSLCISPKVNKWSWFSPRTWILNAGILVDNYKFPFDMSNFCGYNHNAVACVITVDNVSASNTGSFNFYSYVSFGEIDWAALTGALEVVCKVYKDAALVHTFYGSIDTDNPNWISDGLVFSEVLITGAGSYTTQTYFAGAGHVKICDIPGTTGTNAFTVAAYVAPPVEEHATIIQTILGADFLSEYPFAILVENLPLCTLDYGTPQTATIKINGIYLNEAGYGTSTEPDMTGRNLGIWVSAHGLPYAYGGVIRPARANLVGGVCILPSDMQIINTSHYLFELRPI